ncbi:serine/arginine repetitive matrix protein 1-like [Panicum miliaceum]|uniref:Serine/arginine repetitive matrix protein 1-like n=1 Tax=Panicum miliaceum TaxID=4540 RepID=A0A3L6Q364_PANMI|nr:serine/arginine repetitive matrix protein 1-like [Panicum miliaceum]
MPTGQTRAPQPPLPPTPATDPSSPAPTHRRHRTFSSSSFSSSSSLSTASSAASSPSPSPRSRGATSVPFSWEHHPGIPKTRLPASSSPAPATPPLPLPPPLRAPPSRPRHKNHQPTRRRRAGSSQPATVADPFAAALAECTRERAAAAGADSDRRLMDSLFPSPSPAAPAPASCAPGSRRWSIASAGGVVGLLDLYGCKSAMGVAEGAFVVRRPVAVVRPGPGRAGLGRAGRR